MDGLASVNCAEEKTRRLRLSSQRTTRTQRTVLPSRAGQDRHERKPDASAGFMRCDVAGGDLVLVGGEGCQDFALFVLRDLDEVQSASEFCRDFVEFCGGDLEVPMSLLKAERRRAGLGGRELVRPAGDVGHPQRPHELEAGQPSQILGVPSCSCGLDFCRPWGSSRRRR